jgi:hypothetical protein
MNLKGMAASDFICMMAFSPAATTVNHKPWRRCWLNIESIPIPLCYLTLAPADLPRRARTVQVRREGQPAMDAQPDTESYKKPPIGQKKLQEARSRGLCPCQNFL